MRHTSASAPWVPYGFVNNELFSVPTQFRSCSDDGVRANTLVIAQATAEVLTALGLTTSNLGVRYAENPHEFVIRFGDLTQSGFEFSGSGYQRWLWNTERWKGEFTLKKCKRTLRYQWRWWRKINEVGA